MKKALILLVLGLMCLRSHAQDHNSYQNTWIKIDTLEKQGLYRSAWDQAHAVLLKASAAGDDYQKIKALVYELKYRDKIAESATVANIGMLDSVMRASSGAGRAVLESMLAEMYAQYAGANRRRLYGRLPSTGEREDDLTTWSLEHLYGRADSMYQTSVADPAATGSIRLATMGVIVDTGNSLRLEPSLYDLLARRALAFYESPQTGLTRPADQFTISNPEAFASAAAFAGFSFPAADSASWTLKALRLYQSLIDFRLKDNDPAALADADLARLEFVYRHAMLPGKDTLYREALQRTIRTSSGGFLTTKASFMLASWYYSRGSAYDALTHPAGRYDLKKALAILEAIPAKPVDEASVGARAMKANILGGELQLTAERVNLPGKPFRVLVRYKNTPRLYLRVVKLPDDPAAVSTRPAPKASELLDKTAVRRWQDSLPVTGDYQHHSVEIGVDGLAPGRYALLASGSPSFGTGAAPLVYVTLYVSAISIVDNARGDYMILDRTTGQPLAGARVRFWQTTYDYSSRRSSLSSMGSYLADKSGHVRLDTLKQGRSLMAEITWRKDHLYTGETQYVPLVRSASANGDTTSATTLLFTDRSIYRPGQTLYFKGIYLTTRLKTHQSHVAADRKATVYLIDANGRRADSVGVTTNGFGSYQGSFVLNKGQLLGSMRLETSEGDGSAYFSVEQYKRPTFYLAWDTATRAYRLGDTIPVTGEVTAYSQAPLGGATVSYEVTRRTRLRIPYYRMPYPTQVATVARGTVSTDKDGRFRIAFPALADPAADSGALPVFTYSVSVTVTDISGESHAFDKEIPLGYRSMELSLDLPETSEVGSFDSLSLSSRDLSGNFIPAKASLQLFRLQAPGQYIRDRYWEEPDEHLFSREAYRKLFPHDEYARESDPSTWPRSGAVWTGAVTTRASGRIPVDLPKLTPGWYQVLAVAADTDGRPDTARAFIRLYDPGDKKPFFTDPLWTSTTVRDAQPGDKAGWTVGSGTGAYIISQSETTGGAGKIQTTTLGDELRTVHMDVGTSGRGGILVHYLTVRYNRVFTRDVLVRVPWKNKQLHIRYETFRDKLLPGATERWRVKISGPGAQKVNAEMLAAMYDASLDAFRPHQWPGLSIYPTVGSVVRWTGNRDFSDVGSTLLTAQRQPGLPSYSRIDPSLKWFGYTVAPPVIFYARGMNVPMPMALQKKEANADLSGARGPEAAPEADSAASGGGAASTQAPVTRTNFNETAFFLPELHTDDSGDVTFSFTMPDALTRWKMMLFAHTRDMAYAYSEKEVVTRKQLMIQAAFPRFIRQGDRLTLGAKMTNLTDGRLDGTATLELYDLSTRASLGKRFGISDSSHAFRLGAGGASVASWKVTVPRDYTGVVGYRVTATAGALADGEQDALPVLSNRTLVTESLPLYSRGPGTQRIHWDVLTDRGAHDQRQPRSLTVEYASNPVWYAVMALPFMDEELAGHQNASALFNRYYANAISATVAGSLPGFDNTMEAWIQSDSDALKSPLERNESLKTVVLQETPWVTAAESESAQRARVARWFTDGDRRLRLSGSLETLSGLQLSNGGFTWFKGMPDDRFITTQIVTGIGRLRRMGAWPATDSLTLKRIADRGVGYLDLRMREDYTRQLAQKPKQEPGLDLTAIRYLYTRSLFPGVAMADSVGEAYRYYLRLAAKQWTRQSPYDEAMIALALFRSRDKATAAAIIKSLEERAITDPVKGMYWKQPAVRGDWNTAPGQTQSMMIEAFHEINGDQAIVSELCTWLLSQKRTHLWPGGNSTADAIFALMTSGHEWIGTTPTVSVSLGDTTLFGGQQAGGAGYHKATIPGSDITPQMGKISIEVQNAGADQPGWGAVYYQYLDQMNEVSENKAPLSVNRQISLEESTANGEKLIPVTGTSVLKTGDKVMVRMTVKIDQDLDYVHLKDVRASCMEPIDVLSGYHWENGSGYYETVTDAAVHFYFSHLSKGTYVFTYPVYITQSGTFTGGLTTLECLYAPEFTAHSAGEILKVSSTN